MLRALYDGNCVICKSTCENLRALDWLKRIDFVDLHDQADDSERYSILNRESLMREIHVLDSAGVVFAGFAGTRRMLKELPLGFPLWLLLHLPGMNALGKRAYRFIARRRYRINKLLGRRAPDCAAGSCARLP
ncbi:MAG: DUF393 domain-containing protein [Chloroflexi bacterium]|nr:DUF393 domain-containing protein [Chloroflexota bacterium]